MSIQRALAAIVFLTACLSLVFAQQNGTPPKTLAFPLAAPVILVNQAMRPPSWAFVERAMLNAAADGVPAVGEQKRHARRGGQCPGTRRFAGFYMNEDRDAPKLRRSTQDHQEPVQRQQRARGSRRHASGLGRSEQCLRRVTLQHVNEHPRRSPAESVDDDPRGARVPADARCEVQEVAPRVQGPGAGEKLIIGMRRYVNDPTLAFPWDRGWWNNQPARPAGRGRGGRGQ